MTKLRLSLWATAAAMTLFIACVSSSHVRSEEEWKSLSNPQSRKLFFRILQSYFDGRGVDFPDEGRENKVVAGADSRTVDSYLEEPLYQLRSNSLFSV